ncbi:MAG: MgtC/SapB family protein [Armatimonadota bacterium]
MSITNLILAALLGGMIGLNRELHNRPAGLRTHILLALGAAMFATVSHEAAGSVADPTRIAAQVVTGIGFLGAGTIIHQGVEVRGLTTAASMWVSAAVGLTCGFGPDYYLFAVIGSLLAVGTLTSATILERSILKTSHADVVVVVDIVGSLQDMNDQLKAIGFHVKSWKQLNRLADGHAKYRLSLDIPPHVSDPFPLLIAIDGILEVSRS